MMSAHMKVFWQEDCIRCTPAKEMCNILIERKASVNLKLFDIGTIDGMAEAAFHEVISTPTIILVDEDDNELHAWRGEAPSLEELESSINDINIMKL